MLTQSLAQELGPDVRVNGVSPGAILWPEQELAPTLRDEILDRLILKHLGRPQDIAQSVLFLIRDSHYITGQIITVDGGRSLSI
jgi:pteridine reductase